MATKYLYIGTDNILCEIIPDFDPVFPDVPITERYAPDFLALCVVRTEEEIAEQGIHAGMLYVKETDTFSEKPEEPDVPIEEGFTITQAEADAAYREGVNEVE